MPTPWDDQQKPNEKSPHHGRKDDLDELKKRFGTGGKKDDRPNKPKGKPFRELLIDAGMAAPEIAAITAADDTHIVGAFASVWNVTNIPPVRNQGSTPQCVAYSNAYDQAHIDRTEMGRWVDFNEALFFSQIGGGPGGAYLMDGLVRRRDVGYPENDSTPNRGAHRIAAIYDVTISVAGIKAALQALPSNGGVLAISPWAHSWLYPFPSGRLPAFDYSIGGHAWWICGWDDAKGFRIRNSWGTSYGVNGDVYLPYANLPRLWDVQRTKDR